MATFHSYMKDTCTITGPATVNPADPFNTTTAGASVTSKCQFIQETKHILLPDGSQVLSAGLVLLPATAVITANDTVTVNGQPYRVLLLETDGTPHGRAKMKAARVG